MSTRRDVLRTAVEIALGAVGSGVATATRHGGRSTAVDPEQVRASLRRLGDHPPEARRDAWRRFPPAYRETLATALSPDSVVTETRQSASTADATTVTHTVTLRGGLDLVVIAELEHEVSWKYDGVTVRNVEQTTSAKIAREAVSAWRYRGTDQESVANQAAWTDAFVSGRFEWGLPGDGTAQTATAYSELRLRPDGEWAVETSSYEL